MKIKFQFSIRMDDHWSRYYNNFSAGFHGLFSILEVGKAHFRYWVIVSSPLKICKEISKGFQKRLSRETKLQLSRKIQVIPAFLSAIVYTRWTPKTFHEKTSILCKVLSPDNSKLLWWEVCELVCGRGKLFANLRPGIPGIFLYSSLNVRKKNA